MRTCPDRPLDPVLLTAALLQLTTRHKQQPLKLYESQRTGLNAALSPQATCEYRLRKVSRRSCAIIDQISPNDS